jgi:hypothetical protein
MPILKPNPGKQEFALQQPYSIKEILYGGARGGGKTFAGLVWLTEYVEHPRFQGLVIRRNSDDLSDWIERARWMYIGLGGQVTGNPSVIRFPSGAIIRTGHLKDEGTYTKYVGHEYQKILIEELTLISSLDRYLKLISSCRTTIPELKPQVFSTSNPGQIGHLWVKERFIEPAPANIPFIGEDGIKRIYIPATIDDNPKLTNADPDYVQKLEALRFTDEALYRAWRFGDWDIFVGQVFKEWRAGKHVIPAFSFNLEHCRLYAGFDWGYNDPASLHWIAVTPENEFGVKHYIVYREMYANEHRPDWWASEIAHVIRDEPIEGLVMPHDTYSNLGGSVPIEQQFRRVFDDLKVSVPLMPADAQSHRARMSRIALMHNMLAISPDGLPYLLVMDNCRNFTRTLPALPYDDSKPEEIDPLAEDHCLAGDTLILTPDGWQRLDSLDGAKVTGYDSRVVTIETEDGRSLTCTPNHKIMTPDGWIEAQNLKPSSAILWLSPQRFNPITALDTTYAVSTFSTKANAYTESSGLTTEELYQTVIMSTTETRTEQITRSKTLSASRSTNTSAIILPNGLLRELPLGAQTPANLMQDVQRRSTLAYVKKVSPHGKLAKVYDISVDSPLHAFIANGFVVHNSFDSVTYCLYRITNGGQFAAVTPKLPAKQYKEGYLTIDGQLQYNFDMEQALKETSNSSKDWRYN